MSSLRGDDNDTTFTTGWISMDAGEPEQGVEVIVWLGDKDQHRIAYRDLDGWREIMSGWELYTVTHWQPLPPGPETGKTALVFVEPRKVG